MKIIILIILCAQATIASVTKPGTRPFKIKGPVGCSSIHFKKLLEDFYKNQNSKGASQSAKSGVIYFNDPYVSRDINRYLEQSKIKNSTLDEFTNTLIKKCQKSFVDHKNKSMENSDIRVKRMNSITPSFGDLQEDVDNSTLENGSDCMSCKDKVIDKSYCSEIFYKDDSKNCSGQITSDITFNDLEMTLSLATVLAGPIFSSKELMKMRSNIKAKFKSESERYSVPSICYKCTVEKFTKRSERKRFEDRREKLREKVIENFRAKKVESTIREYASFYENIEYLSSIYKKKDINFDVNHLCQEELDQLIKSTDCGFEKGEIGKVLQQSFNNIGFGKSVKVDFVDTSFLNRRLRSSQIELNYKLGKDTLHCPVDHGQFKAFAETEAKNYREIGNKHVYDLSKKVIDQMIWENFDKTKEYCSSDNQNKDPINFLIEMNSVQMQKELYKYSISDSQKFCDFSSKGELLFSLFCELPNGQSLVTQSISSEFLDKDNIEQTYDNTMVTNNEMLLKATLDLVLSNNSRVVAKMKSHKNFCNNISKNKKRTNFIDSLSKQGVDSDIQQTESYIKSECKRFRRVIKNQLCSNQSEVTEFSGLSSDDMRSVLSSTKQAENQINPEELNVMLNSFTCEYNLGGKFDGDKSELDNRAEYEKSGFELTHDFYSAANSKEITTKPVTLSLLEQGNVCDKDIQKEAEENIRNEFLGSGYSSASSNFAQYIDSSTPDDDEVVYSILGGTVRGQSSVSQSFVQDNLEASVIYDIEGSPKENSSSSYFGNMISEAEQNRATWEGKASKSGFSDFPAINPVVNKIDRTPSSVVTPTILDTKESDVEILEYIDEGKIIKAVEEGTVNKDSTKLLLEKILAENKSLQNKVLKLEKQVEKNNIVKIKADDEGLSLAASNFKSLSENKKYAIIPSSNQFVQSSSYKEEPTVHPSFEVSNNPEFVSGEIPTFSSYESARKTAIRQSFDKSTQSADSINSRFLSAKGISDYRQRNWGGSDVESYVEFIKENASVGLILDFDPTGKPVSVKVPWSDNPVSISEIKNEKLRAELFKVSKESIVDMESDSYALYTMSSFGLSLSDFVEKMKEQETQYSALLKTVEEIKNE